MKYPIDKPSKQLKSEESESIRLKTVEFLKNKKIEVIPSQFMKTEYEFREFTISYNQER